jgi:endo-1,4-beta-xylanase
MIYFSIQVQFMKILKFCESAFVLFSCILIGNTSMLKASEPFPSLSELYKDDFQLGTALSIRKTSGFSSPAFKLAKYHFNQVTAENYHKWSPIHPEEDKWNFEMADKLVAWCDKNSISVVGHVFFWHSQCPEWVFQNEKGGLVSKEKLISRMEHHAKTLANRYGNIKTWDVVNEAVEGNGMRKSKWYKILKDDFIPIAFKIAKKVAPHAKLVYNDYSTTNQKKRQQIIKLIKNLKSKKIQIDAVGMQAHWGLKSPSIKEIEKTILAFANEGVKVHITELDIDVLPNAWKYRGADINVRFEHKKEIDPYTEGLPENIAEKLADRYEEIFKLFLKHSNKIDRVTFWGLADGMSWKNNFPVKGRTNYPLLFNRKLEPKKAAYRVAALKGWEPKRTQ